MKAHAFSAVAGYLALLSIQCNAQYPVPCVPVANIESLRQKIEHQNDLILQQGQAILGVYPIKLKLLNDIRTCQANNSSYSLGQLECSKLIQQYNLLEHQEGGEKSYYEAQSNILQILVRNYKDSISRACK